MEKIIHKYICDRCCKEFEGDGMQIDAINFNEFGRERATGNRGFDFCPECTGRFLDWMATKDEPKKKEPAITIETADATPKQKKLTGAAVAKELDVPKMQALRAAGWTLEKIADEMSCTAQTVANRLKKAADAATPTTSEEN